MEIPKTLKGIERRLIEIEEKPHMKVRHFKYASEALSHVEESKIAAEKAVLEKERQFILDRRNAWKSRILWNVAIPICVSVATAVIVAYLLN